jgi:hypothetical protein
MSFPKSIAIAVLALLAVTACGGATATPAGQPIPTAAPASTGAGATTAASPAAGDTAAPPSAAATGGAVVGVPHDLCALLTAAEISSLTGKKYEAGVADTTIGTCSWNVGKSSANSGDLIFAGTQAADLALIKGTFPGGVDATVNGHAAYWNGKQGLGTMWVDLGGGQLFTLSFPRSSDLGETDRALAQRLAEIALGKM